MQEQQENIRSGLNNVKSKVTVLGRYPLINMESEERFSVQQSDVKSKIVSVLSPFIMSKRNFLAKQARELVAINVSDMSGNPSESPHTALAATYLTSKSLKIVGEDCLNEVITLLEERQFVCLNIGVDGESLHLATCLPNGACSTELSLARATMKQLQTISKESLVRSLSVNTSILIPNCENEEEEEYDDIDSEYSGDINSNNLEDAIRIVAGHTSHGDATLEDLEVILSGENKISRPNRESQLQAMRVGDLRSLALKYLFPILKRQWLLKHYGQERITIFFQDGSRKDFIPNNVFFSNSKGYLRTVTFDFAHLLNLFRDSAAKGRLKSMGLCVENLNELSKVEGYKFIDQAIALSQGKLKYDPMNQKCAAKLFSEKTVEGLKAMKDFQSANVIDKISKGLMAMDHSGLPCDSRLMALINLKEFLDREIYVIDRLKRPDDCSITNELYQMVLCSIDSFVCTFLNLEFFNPRRKSTSSVEMLFGQLMMMTDGCMKLNVRQLHDVLQRLTLSNALRLLPSKVRGFKFLGNLRRHMKSYSPDDVEDTSDQKLLYPSVFHSKCIVRSSNSCFDKIQLGKKRTFGESQPRLASEEKSFDGNVRKYFKKVKGMFKFF